MASASDYVLLRGGLGVPLAALQFVWSLEDRGFTIARDGEHHLLVRPAARLSDDDREALLRWKPQILLLDAYCNGTIQ